MHEPPPDAAAKTYLYLRVGLIGAAVFLVVSVLVEIVQGWELNEGLCLQPSISSYYYTPVRAVFVGSLLMVSSALIAIQGDDGLEDLWLTLAGMLAPIVALVPTTNVGICKPLETDTSDALVGVTNNFLSLLIIGGLLWIFAGLTLKESTGKVAKRSWQIVGAVLFAFGLWFALSRPAFDLLSPKVFNQWGHNLAAILMFVFLFFATALSADRCKVRSYKRSYKLLARAMVALTVIVIAVVIIGEFTTKWEHAVFTLEAGEIIIFATYWGIQTHEHRLAAPEQPGHVAEPTAIIKPLWIALKRVFTREPAKPKAQAA